MRPVTDMSEAELRAAVMRTRAENARLKEDQLALVGTINALSRSEVLAERLAGAIRRHTVVASCDEEDSVANEEWRTTLRHIDALLPLLRAGASAEMLTEANHLYSALLAFGSAWGNDVSALRQAAEAYFGGDFQAPLKRGGA